MTTLLEAEMLMHARAWVARWREGDFLNLGLVAAYRQAARMVRSR